MEELELCDGLITDNGRRTLLLKKLTSTVHSSLVSSLQKCESYDAMKKELDAEITFLKGWGPDVGKTGIARVTEDQVLAAESEQAEDDEEGVIELDLSDLPEEKAHALVFAARASGL